MIAIFIREILLRFGWVSQNSYYKGRVYLIVLTFGNSSQNLIFCLKQLLGLNLTMRIEHPTVLKESISFKKCLSIC